MAVGKMRNAESKMWDQKCGMTLIVRGDKPRDRCHSTDYHTSLSSGNAVSVNTTSAPLFVDCHCRRRVHTQFALGVSSRFAETRFAEIRVRGWG